MPWRGRLGRAHGPHVACVDIRPSAKTNVLAFIVGLIHCYVVNLLLQTDDDDGDDNDDD